MLNALQLVESKAIYRQIGDYVRNLIVSGALAPGTKLPSTEELAVTWRTTQKTVQNALSPLVKECLLTRVPKRGTFVRQREERLTRLGIYYAHDYFATNPSEFLQQVHLALREQLIQMGIQPQVWVDVRSEAERAQPWPELWRAVERREIQGLIIAGGAPHLDLLDKLPVPTAHLGGRLPNSVNSDLEQLAELSLRSLAEQGCKSVGLIFSIPVAYRTFYSRFTDLVSDLGLRVKNEWMRIPSADDARRGVSQEEFGYTEFLRLWRQPERPEGLMVFPDTTARSVILGVREQQVRVPEELKLVLVKNETIDLLCPMPATFMVNSERAMARALIEQVQKQFRGEACEPVMIPYRQVAHLAAEQTRCGARPAAAQTCCGARRGSSQSRTSKQPNKERS